MSILFCNNAQCTRHAHASKLAALSTMDMLPRDNNRRDNELPADPRLLPQMRALTQKQRDFVMAYLGPAKLNGREAARKAGYSGGDNALRARASENVQKRNIKAAMRAVIKACVMGKDEALSKLSTIARATIDDFYDIDEDGRPVPNLEKARRRGRLGAIKSVDFTNNGIKLRFHSCLKALDTIVEYMKEGGPKSIEEGVKEQLWRDQQEISEAMGIDFSKYFDQRVSRD